VVEVKTKSFVIWVMMPRMEMPMVMMARVEMARVEMEALGH